MSCKMPKIIVSFENDALERLASNPELKEEVETFGFAVWRQPLQGIIFKRDDTLGLLTTHAEIGGLYRHLLLRVCSGLA